MVSLPCPWGWGMQLPQRLGNNSISLCVRWSLGLRAWELWGQWGRVIIVLLLLSGRFLFPPTRRLPGASVLGQGHVMLFCLSFNQILSWLLWFGVYHAVKKNGSPEFTFAACILGLVIHFGVASFLFVVSYLGGYLISFSSREVSRIQ